MKRPRSVVLVSGIVAVLAIAACEEQITLSPPSPAALVPGEGENIATVNPAHIGATNPGFGTGDCPSTGWGWHFVMQGSPSDNYFVELAATFSRDGEQVRLVAEEFDPNPQHGYIYTDGPGWRLDASEAIVVGGRTQYNLSHVCTGPDAPTTTIPDVTTVPQFVTTTAPEPTTTSSDPVTTIPEPTTTVPDTVTVTEGGLTTTTTGGATTVTQGGLTTTTSAADTTVTQGGGELTTTTSGAATTTVDPDTEGGGVTSTTSGSGDEGTVEPGQVTTTAGEDIGGGSEETLPNTGTGDTSMTGLAGLLVVGGVLLLMLIRRRSGEG